MKQFLFTLLIAFLIPFTLIGQKETLEDLNNKLFCNAYVYGKTDSLTLKFLEQNFPYLTKEKPNGGRSMPPIGPDAKESIVSLKFKKHPFFNFLIKDGRLDFTTIEIPGAPKFETGAELWLFFDKAEDANTAFEELVSLYKNVSTTKEITEINGQRMGKFVEASSNNATHKAILTLSKENNSYTINFKNWFRAN